MSLDYFFSVIIHFSICSSTFSTLFYSSRNIFCYIYLYFIKSFFRIFLVVNEFLVILIKSFEGLHSSWILSTYIVYNYFLSIYFYTFMYQFFKLIKLSFMFFNFI